MPRHKFFIDDPVGRNTVHVISLALLETLLTRTNDITGEIDIDTDNILEQPSVILSVPTDSLDTGVPLINEVLRSDRWLDSSKFPKVKFTLGKVISPTSPTALKDGVPITIEAEGTFELRGASNRCPIQGEITWLKANENTARRLPGDLLHLRARFDLHLLDYGINTHLTPPVLDKVSEALNVHIDLFASTQRPQIPERMAQELARAKKELAQRILSS